MGVRPGEVGVVVDVVGGADVGNDSGRKQRTTVTRSSTRSSHTFKNYAKNRQIVNKLAKNE